MFEFDYEIDGEILISEPDNENDLSELWEDDFEFENEDKTEINIENLPPPSSRFPFDNTLSVNLQFDSNGEETILHYLKFF